MSKDIVEIYDGEARVGTFFVSEGFERDHRLVLKLIRKHEERFVRFGPLKVRNRRSGKRGGRPIEEILLNEDQAMFLGTLFRNSKMVLDFKERLIHNFRKVRNQLSGIFRQHKNIAWIEKREKGKVARLEATDTIKEFNAYAIKQGSENPEMYYMNLTKMLNALLFIVDGRFKNLRDVMNPIQLMIVAGGDLVIRKALQDGMKKNTFYKDIYKLAKERVELFASLHGQSEILSQQLAIDW